MQDLAHRREIRAVQAVAVDLAVRNHAHDDLFRTAEDGPEEIFAALRRALLRVVQQAERPHLVVTQAPVVEQHPRDDERACERAAARLIRAGYEPRTELAIELQEFLAGAERHGRRE